jgi:hypothetical protein
MAGTVANDKVVVRIQPLSSETVMFWVPDAIPVNVAEVVALAQRKL